MISAIALIEKSVYRQVPRDRYERFLFRCRSDRRRSSDLLPSVAAGVAREFRNGGAAFDYPLTAYKSRAFAFRACSTNHGVQRTTAELASGCLKPSVFAGVW